MNTFKKIFAVITMLTVSSVAFAAEKEAIVNPYGTFLSGNGAEVEMAQFVAKNSDGLHDVLLKITGANAFSAGIDGKTIKYTAVPSGTGIDYQAAGKTRMIVRNPYGDSWSQMQVFLDGKAIDVSEDKGRSKEVLPLHLLTASKEAAK